MESANTDNQSLLTLLSAELAAIFFFVPAGRFRIDLGFYDFTTGYDAYKLFPVVFLTWIIWRMREGWKRKVESPLIEPLLFWFLCSFLAALASWEPYQALTESLELFCYLMFFIMLLDLPWARIRTDWLALGFIVGNIYLCGAALFQLATAQSGGEMLRLNAVFDHPNQLGGYAVLAAPLLAWLSLHAKRQWQKQCILLIAVSVLCAGALTLSRSVYVAFSAAGCVVVLFGSRTQRTAGVVLVAALVVVALIAAPSISQRFHDLLDPAQLRDDASRLMIWSAMFDSTLPNLPLFGVGYGPLLQDHLNNWIASAPATGLPLSQWGPHSAYLATLLCAGLPGLCAYLWLLIAAGRQANRCPHSERVLFLAALTGAIVHQAFIFPVLTGNYPIALFALFALAALRTQPEEQP
ncbi:O-antigen ligase family protein [bacterium]|nr:O-antigen ligase family protein [bacterium]